MIKIVVARDIVIYKIHFETALELECEFLEMPIVV